MPYKDFSAMIAIHGSKEPTEFNKGQKHNVSEHIRWFLEMKPQIPSFTSKELMKEIPDALIKSSSNTLSSISRTASEIKSSLSYDVSDEIDSETEKMMLDHVEMIDCTNTYQNRIKNNANIPLSKQTLEFKNPFGHSKPTQAEIAQKFQTGMSYDSKSAIKTVQIQQAIIQIQKNIINLYENNEKSNPKVTELQEQLQKLYRDLFNSEIITDYTENPTYVLQNSNEACTMIDCAAQKNDSLASVLCISSSEEEDDHQCDSITENPNFEFYDSNFSSSEQECVLLDDVDRDPRNLPNTVPDDHPWTPIAFDRLHNVFGLENFRQNQLEAINGTLAGKNAFILMPTGGGKSLCYQLPAIIDCGVTKGLTVVISPLISLMQDQLNHLKKLNIPACVINSELSASDRRNSFDNITSKNIIKLLYITPEFFERSGQLTSALNILYQKNSLARVVIDEAHCVSQWGHDFRPDYTQLGKIRTWFPDIPIMALTATATEIVQKDVIISLNIEDCLRFKQSFNRSNLFYEVRRKTKKVLEDMTSLITSSYRGKSGIIYCLSRTQCEALSEKLNEDYNMKTSFYHAGMDKDKRSKVQSDWQAGKVKIICATIAFGMGIDKADVRFVIHQSMPRSLENFYQETGRAGRDGLDSKCILYYSFKDKQTIEKMIEKSDSTYDQKQRQLDSLKQVYAYCDNEIECRRKQLLAYFNEDFHVSDCSNSCDNCCSDKEIERKDVTKEANSVVSLVEKITGNWTLIKIAEILKGSKSFKYVSRSVDEIEEFGALRSWSKGDIERLLYELVNLKLLKLHVQTNRSGFSTSYVKVNHLHSINKEENSKVTLNFKTDRKRSIEKYTSIPFVNSYKKTKFDQRIKNIDDFGPIREVNANIAVENEGHIIDPTKLGSQNELSEKELDMRSQFIQEAMNIRSCIANQFGIKQMATIFTDYHLGRLAKFLPITIDEAKRIHELPRDKVNKWYHKFHQLCEKYSKTKCLEKFRYK